MAILFSLFGSQIAALAAVQGIGVELSPRSVPVGEGTVLSVRVQGGGNENKPVVKADPAVRIQEAGANTNVQLSFMNGRTQKVNDVTFRYVLRGLKKGTFEIKVEVPDGDEVLIPADPVILTVRDKTDMELKMEPFLKVNLDKASLYAGESVPIELSLYYPVETRIRQVTNRPVIPADGVLIEEMGEWMKGGEVGQHAVAIVRGRLTTLKPGKFRIGPAEVSLALSLPRHLRLGSTKSYALKSDAIELEVKPLPSTGVPEGFAGLVGNYQVEIDASPLELDSSDPISLKLRVTGKGDLRKVEIPKMTNNQGWRHYEPERFEEKNREGELTGIAFTQVIVPQADHDVIPSFRLPHFDPDQGRYIVAATAPIPIKLNYREQSSTASPVIASNETTDPRADEVPDAVAPPLAEMTDILGIRTGFAQTWATGRTSFLSSPVFWAVQAVPASLLAVILGAVARRKILERRAEKKLPTWSETHSAFNGIAASATAGEFYRYAVEGLNAWERENKDRLPEDEEVIEGMRRIRGKHDFIEFGGVGTAGEKALDGSERERVKKTMAALEKLRSAALRS
ncbi:MAG: BatD family protein [Verrucomicrobiota bacterium]